MKQEGTGQVLFFLLALRGKAFGFSGLSETAVMTPVTVSYTHLDVYKRQALAVCIASASLWLLPATIPLILVTHGVILGEERYCMTTYGEEDVYKRQFMYRLSNCLPLLCKHLWRCTANQKERFMPRSLSSGVSC